MTKITQPRLLAGPARFNVFLLVLPNDCLLVKLDEILTVIPWGQYFGDRSTTNSYKLITIYNYKIYNYTNNIITIEDTWINSMHMHGIDAWWSRHCMLTHARYAWCGISALRIPTKYVYKFKYIWMLRLVLTLSDWHRFSLSCCTLRQWRFQDVAWGKLPK